MIVVKVELHSANTGVISELGRMIIHNVGGTKTRGDYRVALGRKGDISTRNILQNPQRESSVREHARLSASVWTLVGKAIASVGHARAWTEETVNGQAAHSPPAEDSPQVEGNHPRRSIGGPDSQGEVRTDRLDAREEAEGEAGGPESRERVQRLSLGDEDLQAIAISINVLQDTFGFRRFCMLLRQHLPELDAALNRGAW